MTKNEAEEIIYKYEYWEDKPCSCPMGHPPCAKCVDSPLEEEYKIAIKILDEI